MSAVSRFLARWRVWLFVVTVCLVVVGALLVPYIFVNTDMTKYLPDDYPMKVGLDIVREQIPDMEEQIQSLGSSFGDGSALMPSNLPRTMAIGVFLLFVVLLVMCSSLMEVLLFLITALSAVILNMGTNALLPSVSMMTNTLTPVLQMVLSMDYSIILMNRYRQERSQGRLPADSISGALEGATPAILSSAFTTIVSLLMLTFIKLKIGADLGYVLAKGVAFSLLCNFTVLPALIVWADKSVIYKTKKTPRFPSAAVSRFQTRFRVPLALLFVAVVTAAIIFQSRTPIVFAPQWDSEASEHAREDNPLLLLYSTADEAAVPGLMQLLERDTSVVLTVSYPTTLGRPCTASDMYAMISGYGAQDFPEEFLQMVFYAMSHPASDGRLSFAEIETAARRLSDEGMMPEGMSFDKMVAQVMRQAELQVPEPAEEIPAALDTTAVEVVAVPDTTLVAVAPVTDSAAAKPVVQPAPERTEDNAGLSYADITAQRTVSQMAAVLGVDSRQLSMAYRLAGKARGTMSISELYIFARDHILGNRRYEAFIPKDMKQKLTDIGGQVEVLLAAGEPTEPAAADSLLTSEILPEMEPAAEEAAQELSQPEEAPGPVVAEPQPAPEPQPEPQPTPLGRLIDMMLSGRRYSAAQVHSALNAAGIDVSRDNVDLLYLYALSGRDFDPEQTVTPEQLIRYVADTMLTKPSLQQFVSDDTRSMVDSVHTLISENAGKLRGENYSFAVVSTKYPMESDETYAFVDNVRAAADSLLPGTHYWIGESEMYKELKDAFPSELMLLTILTVLAIYLIVAVTFRSLLIPVPLVLSVMAGVYANVIVAGFNGGFMYYLAYLIIQGILMGAAIDYSILFTSYFRSARKSQGVGEAIRTAFEGSSHSVLTSGIILSLVPMIMSVVIGDPMLSIILKSLSIGALASVVIILLLLPAVLAVMDPLITRKDKSKQTT